MDEQELRALVRNVVADRLTARARNAGAEVPHHHASHARLTMVVPTQPGSPCVIEPGVRCNQCGYCLSLGH
jgi:hypothetical protein